MENLGAAVLRTAGPSALRSPLIVGRKRPATSGLHALALKPYRLFYH